MAKRIEADDDGYIHISPDALGDRRPHAQYEIEREGDTFIIRPLSQAERYWAETTPEQRVKDFLEWANQPRPNVPVLPDEAMHRESFYD